MLLVLDDDRERLSGFRQLTPTLATGLQLKSWISALNMMAELDKDLRGARLISLDHDLYKQSGSDADPGSGRDVADYLARRKPVCPIIVHSSNTDAAWGMYNILTFTGWTVEIVHHLNEPDWILNRWLPVARALWNKTGNLEVDAEQLVAVDYPKRRLNLGPLLRGHMKRKGFAETTLKAIGGNALHFAQSIEVSLDCCACQRLHRTVIFSAPGAVGKCTPTWHKFPGSLVAVNQTRNGARYELDYDYEPFVDSKYPDRKHYAGLENGALYWARIHFNVSCAACGGVFPDSTQSNLVRPVVRVCTCGTPLYEDAEPPRLWWSHAA